MAQRESPKQYSRRLSIDAARKRRYAAIKRGDRCTEAYNQGLIHAYQQEQGLRRLYWDR